MTKPIALITGPAKGIGREIADLLAVSHDLVLVGRNYAALHELAAVMMATHGAAAHVIVADLAEPGSAKKVFDETRTRGLQIDVLVNNAGVGMHGAVADIDFAAQSRMLQLNSVSLAEMCALFAGPMRERRRGKIMNISSTAAYQPTPYMATYGASKTFVLNFSEALAKELEDYGVTVTAVSPGPTETAFFSDLGAQAGTVGHFAAKHRGSARDVAQTAITAMNRGKLSTIVGLKHWLLAFVQRLTPRFLVARISKGLLAPRTA